MEVNKMNKTLRKEMKVKKMKDGKSVKTGSDFLSQAKEKISGLVKPTGKKIPKRNFAEDISKVVGMTPAGFIRKKAASLISKVPGVKRSVKKVADKARSVVRGVQQRNVKGQGSGKFNPPTVRPPTGSGGGGKPNVPALRRPTQIRKRSTALTAKPKVTALPRPRPNRLGQASRRAALITGTSQLIKPKTGTAKSKTMPPVPKPRPEPKVKKPTTPKVEKKTLPKVVKKKRSNIKGSSSYDAQFTYDKLKEKGGKKFAKARMSKENFAKVKKMSSGKLVGGQKKLDVNNDGKISGQDFKMLRSSKGMRGGGKVIKMRGGGAATRGMNFNRGY
tara:strand:+ start:730 stop:1725 length:996 start_codon:yes stop_codon:yes gene_type:complete